MPGIYPGSGVPAADALNTVNADTVNCTDELFYSTSRCQPRFDPAAANAMISEVLNLVNCSGNDYDCSILDNLCTAVADMVLLNETITTVTGTNVGNQIATYNNEAGAAVNINETVTVITNTVPGHQIANYTNENGAVFGIRETITSLSLDGGGNLVYDDENGASTVIPLAAACCVDSNLLQFVGGNTFRSTVTENGIPFVSNLAAPLLGACTRPATILGTNAGGALVQTALPPLDGGFRRDDAASSDMFAGNPTPDPSAPAGTVFTSNILAVQLTNPSSCLSMEIEALFIASCNMDLRGDGQITWSIEANVNGGGFVATATALYARTNNPVGFQLRDRMTIRGILRTFAEPPSGVQTIVARLVMTVNNPFDPGSSVNPSSLNIGTWGGN